MNVKADIPSLITEIDYGTPASKAEKQVTLTVDGRTITVPEGTSIMRAAADLGIMVPKLCATDNLDPFGSCRLCLVEIEGRNGTSRRNPACRWRTASGSRRRLPSRRA